MNCKECNGKGKSFYYVETHRDGNSVTISKKEDICRSCNGSGVVQITNSDYLRSMNDNELAFWIDKMYLKCPWCDYKTSCYGIECSECIEKWLKQPREE